MNFPTDIESIFEQVDRVNPIKYGRTRNFKNGAVSYLSPYISRGVISTRIVMRNLIEKGYHLENAEKFFQELAWRDYWQRKWQALGEKLNSNLKNGQYTPVHEKIPVAALTSSTGIDSIDDSLEHLYSSGYMHNHMRMYVASIICHVAKSDWRMPAKWMYYHLLDADWASNALSWQWVAGTSRNKIYIANQENINKYWSDDQRGTFLDVSYNALPPVEIPESLSKVTLPEFKTALPSQRTIITDQSLPTLIYTVYNLDPFWQEELEANRILLLEPSMFERYPMSEKVMDFIYALSENIQGIQLFVGSFNELKERLGNSTVHFKEHPLNGHFEGELHERDWMFPEVTEAKGSFFQFWKECRKFFP